MLITIENNDGRVTIDTATATALGSEPGAGRGASGLPSDVDAGPARFDPIAGGASDSGVLDGGAYRA